MISRIDPTWTLCLAVSVALHAAFLAWVGLTGGGTSATSPTLQVLLTSPEAGSVERALPPENLLSSYRSRDLFARPVSPPPAPPPAARVASGAPATEARTQVESLRARTAALTTVRNRVEPEDRPKSPDDTGKSPELAALKPAPAVPAAEKSDPLAGTDAGAINASPGAASAGERAAANPGESTPAAAPARSGVLLALLHQAIEKRKHYPGLARRQGRQGTATVRFRLSPSGEMDAVTLDRSSGFRALDTAALSAVSGVAPFAPARTFLSEATPFTINVTFRLN